MEKKRAKRILVDLEATITLDSNNYQGYIWNVSQEGLSIRTIYLKSTVEYFNTKKPIKLSFEIPSGETLFLNCKIKWFLRVPNSYRITVGMAIIKPTLKYKEFYKSLNKVNGA